jgi:hypothetical protein
MLFAPDKRQQKLILDFSLEDINEERFFKEYPTSRGEIVELILNMLTEALQQQNADTVELGVMLVYHFGVTKVYLQILNDLAQEPWHSCHEDIVFALGKLKDPSSIEILTQTAQAKYPYTEADEFFVLGTKSLYALRNIGTYEAVLKIAELTRTENNILKSTALGLLSDLAESGESELVKQTAKNLSNASKY